MTRHSQIASVFIGGILLSSNPANSDGIFFKVSPNGKVQVGETTIDPVPPGARVLERVIKGDSVDRALDEEIKSRTNDLKSMANIPDLQTQIEDQFFDKIAKVIGEDAVGVVRIFNLPERITRATPKALVLMLEGPNDLGDILKKMAGAPLLTALTEARDYYKDKGRPVPQTVKVLLSKSFSPQILNNARFVVDDFNGGTVPAIINKIHETFGEQYAVTIDNIIIFSSNPKDENIFFWAHEMQHTVQYARLGMAGFAGEYTTKHQALEDEANRVAGEAEKNAVDILKLLQALAALKN